MSGMDEPSEGAVALAETEGPLTVKEAAKTT